MAKFRPTFKDGGSEFESVFEEEYQKRNTRLFVLPPNSPKLNGYVERAHLTHTEESYEVTDSSSHVPELRNNLLDWEKVSRYNRDNSALPIFGLPYPSGVPLV
jgi:putative transposase